MSSIRRSLFISLTERYLIIALKLTSFFILARLLTPEEIGLFSVSAAFIGLAHVVRDFGVGSYLIQEKDLTLHRKRTAFTITLIIGLSFFFIIQLSSAPIASFYNDNRMQYVLQLLAFNFLLIPFNSVTLATLRRDMKFNVLFWINIAAAIVGTTTALTLAALDFGFMSLVWSSIANTATTCLGGLVYRRSEFWLHPSLREWRRIFSFGSQATAASVVTEIAMNTNDLIVGRLLGFSPVAILSRAQGVMYLFQRDIMSAIRNVAYPGFAKAYRDGADMEAIHTRTVTAITVIAWPFYGFLALFSLEILRVLFGPQWDEAAPLVPVFCLAGAFAAIYNLQPQLLIAMGKVNISIRATITIQLIRICSVITCAFLFKELIAFAYALLFTFFIGIFIQEYYKAKVLKTQWREKLIGLKQSFLLTITTLIIPISFQIYIHLYEIIINEYILVSFMSFIAIISWVVGLKLFNHPITTDPIFPDKISKWLKSKKLKVST